MIIGEFFIYMISWIIKIPQVKSPKMNDNIGEQVACGSNLGSSQINEPILLINYMGTKKSSMVNELSVCL